MVYQNSLPSAVAPFSPPLFELLSVIQNPEYTRSLNVSRQGNSETWIYQGSVYTSWFWIYERNAYVRTAQGSDMSGYA